MKKRYVVPLALVALGLGAFFVYRNSTRQPITEAAFTADGRCPSFKPRYPQVKIEFGNRGLSVLNSVYETFVGEGAFEISEFRVATLGPGRFTIVGLSNRGPLTSQIVADRLVRQGQDREDEVLRRTLESSYCNGGRIFEHQLVDMGDGSITSQDLEYWTEGDVFYFRLYQNRFLTAQVVAR